MQSQEKQEAMSYSIRIGYDSLPSDRDNNSGLSEGLSEKETDE